MASEPDVDEVAHDVRKRCKRVRAMLRLIRDAVGKEVYRRENRVLRDAARALSPVRDAAVLVQVHDDIVRAGALPPAGFRLDLVERHQDLRHQVFDGDTLPEIRESIATVLARTETWPITTVEWDVLAPGLERVYRKGQKAMAAAYDDPGPELFHQWRTPVRYLRHQLQFLEELWPEVIRGNAKSAHALTDVLGDAHDLANLYQALLAGAGEPAGDTQHLSEFIQSQRRLLRVRARPIGLRLYAEKPSRFIARLGRYWEAGMQAGVAA
ncbi:MAG: CHAD domain-containing protein [Actinobacteria bacterium]|nr:CHAD domain-containing protein [Actinomycetota bacterium]